MIPTSPSPFSFASRVSNKDHQKLNIKMQTKGRGHRRCGRQRFSTRMQARVHQLQWMYHALEGEEVSGLTTWPNAHGWWAKSSPTLCDVHRMDHATTMERAFEVDSANANQFTNANRTKSSMIFFQKNSCTKSPDCKSKIVKKSWRKDNGTKYKRGQLTGMISEWSVHVWFRLRTRK